MYAARVTTLTPLTTVVFFVAIEVLLAFLCVDLQDSTWVILTGDVGGTVRFFSFGLTFGHGALWLAELGLVGSRPSS
ncbi:MAG: hypothetical protein KO254_07600 [Methanoculleus marisnigri]|nr:hypothetical protein [Methanoculleus marisnigri]